MRRPSPILVVTLLSSLPILGGCPPGDTDAGSTPSDGGDGGGDGDGDVDAGLDLTRDPACDKGEWVVVMRGTVERADGSAAGDALFQSCVRNIEGILTCLAPTAVDADGSFEVVVPETVRCVDTITSRVFVPNGDATTAYCHIELTPNEPIQAFAEPFTLYPTAPATSLPPLGTPEDAREVVFEGGLSVSLVPSEYFADRGPTSSDPSYNHLASAVFEGAQADDLCFMHESPAMLAVFGFSPEGDLGERASLRYGPTSLSAGVTVPLYALGGLSCSLDDDTSIAEGNWETFGNGTVDSDGYVVAELDNGLPCLIWMGIGAPESSEAPADGGVADGG
jgi:hypothetical protein